MNIEYLDNSAFLKDCGLIPGTRSMAQTELPKDKQCLILALVSTYQA